MMIRVVFIVLILLPVLTTTVSAQEIIKTCAGMEVRSINVSRDTGKNWLLSTGAEIDVLPISATPEKSGKVSIIVAYGTILAWPQDSQEVETNLVCTAKGLRLEVTIVHIFDGDVLKSVLWRPRIELNVFVRQPEVVFESIWKMRLIDGKSMDRARTPPYPEKKYPITATKIMHWRQN